MDRAQGLDLADRYARRAERHRRNRTHCPAACDLTEGCVFDLTLTFDNGPEPGVTPRVLEILRERGIKATFFVIGEQPGDPERQRLAGRADGGAPRPGHRPFGPTRTPGPRRDHHTAPHTSRTA